MTLAIPPSFAKLTPINSALVFGSPTPLLLPPCRCRRECTRLSRNRSRMWSVAPSRSPLSLARPDSELCALGSFCAVPRPCFAV